MNNSRKPIRMADPWVTNHERRVVDVAMRNGWTNYDYVEKFQPAFAKYHGRKFGVMTPNCTSAIHLILLALGIHEGDEVIVPDCTWTASVAPITYQRAIPVFCDIEADTWCLDPKSVEKRITKRTKAIIVVDLYGNMPNMDALVKIAKKYKLFLIEDAAEALGSTYKGIKAGKFGIGSVFSFHRTKTLTTGEGGMLLVDDKKLYERAMFLRDLGRDPKISYYILEAGPKYMPFNIQAAIGYAQFQRLDKLLAKKRQIFKWYQKHLADIPDIQLNMDTKDVHNGVWATSLVFGKSLDMTREKAIEGLTVLGLPSRPFFYPLSSLPAYVHYKTGDKKRNPVAYDVSARGITLPASYDLTEQQVREYCKAIKTILKMP